MRNPIKSREHGYTLMEIAIVLAVVGVLMTAFLPVYRLYVKRQVQQSTEVNSSLAISAISNFLIQKGRYPCPARIDALRDDADYGVETQCDPTGAGYPGATTAGTFMNGLWFEDSLTTVDVNPDPLVSTIVTPKVRRGGLPFRSLALPENMSFDGLGNRFAYAITEPQAVTSTYQKGNGGISITNTQGQPLFQVAAGSNNIFLRPDGTLQATNMNPNANVHLEMDETAADDSASFARSNANSVPDLRLTLSDPSGLIDSSGTVTVRAKIARVNGSGALRSTGNDVTNFYVRIFEGGTQIASVGPATVNFGVWTDVSFTFPASAVTNWSDLRIHMTHDAVGGRGVGITWLELEAPRLQGTFVDYFMYSAGPDKAGSYSRAGTLIAPCPATGLDRENCNTGSGNPANKAIYNMSERSDAPGATHFDDFAKFYQSTEVPLWRVSGNGAHIRDLLNVESTNGKIAIAQSPDMAPGAAVLQVGGQVRTETASTMVSEICDSAKNNCFVPERLGTADPTFQCPPGEHATGFEAGAIKCTATQYTSCSAGQVMTGVRPDGTLECTNVVGCPPIDTWMCYDSSTGNYDIKTIPAGIQGQTYTTPISGYNVTETWRCGVDGSGANTGPWWEFISWGGICDCAPVDEVETVPCNSVMNGNWSGTVTRRHEHTCPADQDIYTPISDTCACVDFVETQVDACDPGFSGSITQQRTWSCSSGTAGSWSTWTVPAGGNTCACTGQPAQTQTLTCPMGASGTQVQQNDFQCPAGTWSGWYDTTNTCTCDPTLSEDRTVGCQAGYNGDITERRTFDCGTNNWGNWAAVINNCTCTPQTETQTLSCQPGYSGQITQTRDFQCPAATWTGWTTASDTCACNPGATQNQTVPCPAPQSGTLNQRRDFNCSSNSWGSWYDTANNCYIQTYTWTPKTASSGPYSSALPVRAGDTCGTLNASTPCASQASGGLGWYHYAECKCE